MNIKKSLSATALVFAVIASLAAMAIAYATSSVSHFAEPKAPIKASRGSMAVAFNFVGYADVTLNVETDGDVTEIYEDRYSRNDDRYTTYLFKLPYEEGGTYSLSIAVPNSLTGTVNTYSVDLEIENAYAFYQFELNLDETAENVYVKTVNEIKNESSSSYIKNIYFPGKLFLEPTGDANGDGIVDAVDASLVMAHYASLSIGGDAVIPADTLRCVDMNGDGAVDAVDASVIIGIYSDTMVKSSDSDVL